MSTITELITNARIILNNKLTYLTIIYNGNTYNVNDLINDTNLAIYIEAASQKMINSRAVILPSTLLPQAFTNQDVMNFMQISVEEIQKNIDTYQYIVQQINALVITDYSQIPTVWDNYLSTYINPRTFVPTNDSLANSLATLSTTVSNLKIPTQADWLQTDNSLLSYIKNKPTIPNAQIQVDWSQSNNALVDFIKNKPSIPAAQIQSDWTQTNNSLLDFIKNKPANKSFSYPVRSLNTAYQPSTSQDTFVSSAVDIACTLTLSGGQTGTVIFEIADDSGFTTNVQTVNSTANGNTGTLTIGLSLTQTATASVCGGVPKSKYYRLRSVNTTGTPTFTMRSIQEILF